MSDPPSPRVIGPDEGEALLLRPPSRSGGVTIKVDPRTCGARALSMGTQRIEPGAGIPVHRHEAQEEILVIRSGTALVILGEERAPAGPGATVYVPAGTWHGLENTGAGPLEIVWIISPPGLEEMFRAIGTPAGAQPEPLSPEEFAALAALHGMQVRPG